MLIKPKPSLLRFLQIKIPSAMTTNGIFYCAPAVQPSLEFMFYTNRDIVSINFIIKIEAAVPSE